MSWAIGWSERSKRDIGYGVPAHCDHPDCSKEIDRGLSYLCGDGADGDEGCGLFFCSDHLTTNDDGAQVCERCAEGKEPFAPKSDHPEWLHFKETDESWKEWRESRAGEKEE